MKKARLLLLLLQAFHFTILIQGSPDSEACWTNLPSPERCSSYNASENWLNPCYCTVNNPKDTLTKNALFCCNFNGYAANLSHVLLGFDTLDFYNTSQLIVKLHTSEVNNVHLHFVSNAEFKQTSTQCWNDLELGVFDSSLSSLPKSEWITVIKSDVEDISLNACMHVLKIQLSVVEKLSDLTITDQNLDQSSKVMHIQNSHVRSMRYIETYGRVALIQESVFHEIDHCTIETAHFEKTLIGTVLPFALISGKGGMVLHDVFIRHLHRGGIVINSDFSITNVVIEKCEEPCFTVEIIGRLTHVENFTVNNRRYSSMANSAFRSEQNRKRVNELGMKIGFCELVGTDVICNNTVPRNLELVLQKEVFQETIQILNLRDIDVYTGSYYTVLLKNVTGNYYANDSDVLFKKPTPVPGRDYHHLTVVNSTLGTIFDRSVSKFDANRTTNLSFLDLGNVRHFDVRKTSIKYLENLEYKNEKNDSGFIFSSGSIEVIERLVLRSSGRLENSTIGMVERLVINIDGNDTRRTVIENCKIKEVLRRGITIENGYLELRNVTVEKSSPEIIRLGPGGKLFLRDMDSDSIGCSPDNLVFSALHRTQIIFIGRTTPSWLYYCIGIRSSAPQIPVDHFINFHRRCVTRGRDEVFCRMLGSSRLTLLGNSSDFDLYRRVHVSEANNFVLTEHCIDQVSMYAVISTDMTTSSDTCYFSLSCLQSELAKIQGNLDSLELKESTVKELRPSSRVNTFTAVKMRIDIVSVHAGIIYLKNTNITHVEKLRADKTMIIENCELYFVRNGSIVIPEGGLLKIINSTIVDINTGAITLIGRMRWDRVVVYTVAAESFRLGHRAEIEFNDVDFKAENAPRMFTYIDKPSFVMQNVTFARKNCSFHEHIGFEMTEEEEDALIARAEYYIEQLKYEIYVLLCSFPTLMVIAFIVLMTVASAMFRKSALSILCDDVWRPTKRWFRRLVKRLPSWCSATGTPTARPEAMPMNAMADASTSNPPADVEQQEGGRAEPAQAAQEGGRAEPAQAAQEGGRAEPAQAAQDEAPRVPRVYKRPKRATSRSRLH